jgi:hypothetical protein
MWVPSSALSVLRWRLANRYIPISEPSGLPESPKMAMADLGHLAMNEMGAAFSAFSQHRSACAAPGNLDF